MKKIGIYHNNCYDGITAAWVLDMVFGRTIELVPMNYSDEPPDCRGTLVYMCDFSLKRPAMEKIIAEAARVTVLDHHATAEKELEGLENPKLLVVFDMERSGAGITWDFFCNGNTRPALVNYIEDRDLWRFALPNSKTINAWIQSFPITLEAWKNEVAPYLDSQYIPERVTNEGNAILRTQESYTNAIVANSYLVQFNNYICPYVQTSILMSEVCSAMLQKYPEYPFVMYSFTRKDGKTQYGLRSRPDYDCSPIAKKFGGGGHRNAAGFELKEPLF